MSVLKILSLVLICGCICFSLNADQHDGETRFQQELEENDFEALQDFIKAKRAIPLADKLQNLHITADIRARYRYQGEKLKGENLRGGENGIFVFFEDEQVNEEIYLTGERLPVSRYEEDVEFNLYFDYYTECTWAHAWLKFDESAGVNDNGLDAMIDPEGYHGSGSCGNLCLREAYMGYLLYNDDCNCLYVELGRLGDLYNVFDSQLQFLSRADGAVLTYWNFCNFAASYVKWAGFVVDERSDHFAWAAELGLLNICNTALDFKYSFIDWIKHGRNRCFVNNPIGFKFRISQFLLTYHLNPQWFWGLPTKIFGAFLWNHSPARMTYQNGIAIKIPTKNIGWYLGFKIGEVWEEGDWSFEGMYAVCQAQCMPDDDVREIGTGNVLQNSFTANARGNTNWRGWQFYGIYALTDNILLDTLVVHSYADDPGIGGSHAYSKVRLEAIYAF